MCSLLKLFTVRGKINVGFSPRSVLWIPANETNMNTTRHSSFFYGWVIIAVGMITGMLVFSGLGSFVSERLLPNARTAMPFVFAGIATHCRRLELAANSAQFRSSHQPNGSCANQQDLGRTAIWPEAQRKLEQRWELDSNLLCAPGDRWMDANERVVR